MTMKTIAWFSVCLAVIYSAPTSANKRLVLHSDLDVSSAFGIIDKNLTEFEKRILQVESRIGQLEAENKYLTTENKNLGKKVTLLENSTQQLTAQLARIGDQNGGATFVRWGRTTCPGNGTSFVYKGYIGGSLYSDKGGGSNSLCLPFFPTWNAFEEGFTNYKAAIYGGEIEVDPSFSAKAFGYNYNNEDPPCATCLTSRETVVMIPGRTNCYPGWTMEYTGYLVGGAQGHSSSNYICLDSNPETVPNGLSSSSDDQHVLYFTEVHCGSLPCPPYHAGRELACAVCSK